jgi:hypothetical protein
MSDVCRERTVTNWLQALLRYAVTLDDADLSVVLTVAEDIDRIGSPANHASTFQFFRRTSTALCKAIADGDDPQRDAVLGLHLKRIGDRRLRRAFEAAFASERASLAARSTIKIKNKPGRESLWKGLRGSEGGSRAATPRPACQLQRCDRSED